MLKWHFRKKKLNVHHKWHSGTSGTHTDDGKLLCLQKWYSSGNDSAGFLFFSFVRTEEHKPICSFSRVNSKSWLAPHSSFYHARASHEVDDDFLKNEKCSCKRKWVWYLSHLILPKHTLQTPQTINKIVPLLPSVSKKIAHKHVHAAANGEFTTVLTWFLCHFGTQTKEIDA